MSEKRQTGYRFNYIDRMPWITAEIGCPTGLITHKFILDSGSVYSHAPITLALKLGLKVPTDDQQLAREMTSLPTRCFDLNGQELKGIPFDIKMTLGRIVVTETIYFRPKLKYSVLGHNGTLERHPLFLCSRKSQNGYFCLFEGEEHIPPGLALMEECIGATT